MKKNRNEKRRLQMRKAATASKHEVKQNTISKKMLSVILAFVFVLTVIPTSVFMLRGKADELAEEAEKVVTAAQSKADELAEESEKAVAEALAAVSQANERIKTAFINYDSSSVMLKASVENLLSVLEGLTGGKE